MHAHSSHAALHRTRACTAAQRRTHIGTQRTQGARVGVTAACSRDRRRGSHARTRTHAHTHRGSKGLHGPRYSHSRLQNTGDNRALAAAIKSKQQNGQERKHPSARRPHVHTHASARAHTHTNTPTRVAKRTSPRRLRCARTVGAHERECACACAYCCDRLRTRERRLVSLFQVRARPHRQGLDRIDEASAAFLGSQVGSAARSSHNVCVVRWYTERQAYRVCRPGSTAIEARWSSARRARRRSCASSAGSTGSARCKSACTSRC